MGRMDESMQMVAICQDFGWTYEEYIAQPAYFIQLIKQKMIIDAKERELEAKRHKYGN
jgi:hypothetical protein